MTLKKIPTLAIAAHMITACSTNRYGNAELMGLNGDEWIGVGENQVII